ncbi:hypothetical protein [Kribbella sp. NPDC023855]|uniref:hypothetical protein n=1 Tax=Kribbella sp. NPDC023855 TaxID=3154698 RepID=UPI003409476D
MKTPLGNALDAVVRDLRNTGGIELDILDEPATDDPAYESVWLLAGRQWRTGVLAPIDMDQPRRLVHVAEQVQEFVLEELPGRGLPATWPECPDHPASHPLTPKLTKAGPSWCCPKSDATISAIGELQQ